MNIQSSVILDPRLIVGSVGNEHARHPEITVREAQTIPTGGAPPAGGRREDILLAALRVFSELGFAKATIKRIAAAAGLRSPALIYWYVDNKQELLRAVLERFALPLMAAQKAAPNPDTPPEEYLRAVAQGLLEFVKDPTVKQIWKLGLSEYALVAELGVTFMAENRPENLVVFIRDYLDRQIQLGRLRAHDSQMSAQSFLAQLWLQVETQHFFPGLFTVRNDEEFVDVMVPMFLDGLRA